MSDENEMIHISQKELDQKLSDARKAGYDEGYDDGYDAGAMDS